MKIFGCLLSCFFVLGGLVSGQVKPAVEKKSDLTLMVEILPNVNDVGEVVPVDVEGRKRLMNQITERLGSIMVMNAEINILKNGKIEAVFENLADAKREAVVGLFKASGNLTIHSAHPEGANTKLAKAVFDKEEIVPGFMAAVQERMNDEDEVVNHYYLVRRKPALTGEHIEAAFPDQVEKGNVYIRLTAKGGERMTDFTKSLKRGDLIVTILDGKVVSAASLNTDSLGRNFVISGQQNAEESQALAEALLSPFEYQLRVTEVKK